MDPTLQTPLTSPAFGATGSEAGNVSHTIEAGYGANIGSDAAAFAGSLERAEQSAAPTSVAKAMFEPLGRINTEARDLVDYAQSALESGNELTPSEIVMLTARSQEFMFHAQLTANVANRTADGLQQLFRQQS